MRRGTGRGEKRNTVRLAISLSLSVCPIVKSTNRFVLEKMGKSENRKRGRARVILKGGVGVEMRWEMSGRADSLHVAMEGPPENIVLEGGRERAEEGKEMAQCKRK